MPYMIFDVGRAARRGQVTHVLPLGQRGERTAACGASPADWSVEGRRRGWRLLNAPVTCAKCLRYVPDEIVRGWAATESHYGGVSK